MKYKRTFASQIKINDIIKYNGDHYDVSYTEHDQENKKTKIRAISFYKDAFIDGWFNDDFVMNVLITNSKGIFE